MAGGENVVSNVGRGLPSGYARTADAVMDVGSVRDHARRLLVHLFATK